MDCDTKTESLIVMKNIVEFPDPNMTIPVLLPFMTHLLPSQDPLPRWVFGPGVRDLFLYVRTKGRAYDGKCFVGTGRYGGGFGETGGYGG